MRHVSLMLILVLPVSYACRSQAVNSAEEYYRSGIAKGDKGDLAGAILDYNQAIEINPRHAAAYASRGVAREAIARETKGDAAGAISDYDRAIDLDPAVKEVYNNRGFARQLKGDLDGAIADFTKAVEIDANFAAAYYNRARASSAKGDLDRAIVDFTRAIEAPHNPYLSESHDGRGLVRHKRGDSVGAIADFTKAIEINPDNIYAYKNRGYVLLLLGRDREALKDFDYLLRSAAELSPDARASFERAIKETIEKAKEERAARKKST
jgi:tetratricopeptide (TPR) repeat protein